MLERRADEGIQLERASRREEQALPVSLEKLGREVEQVAALLN